MEKSDGVAVKTFSEDFLGEHVHFYVLRLKESFLLWIGTAANFRSLAVAMNTRLVKGLIVLAKCMPNKFLCPMSA